MTIREKKLHDKCMRQCSRVLKDTQKGLLCMSQEHSHVLNEAETEMDLTNFLFDRKSPYRSPSLPHYSIPISEFPRHSFQVNKVSATAIPHVPTCTKSSKTTLTVPSHLQVTMSTAGIGTTTVTYTIGKPMFTPAQSKSTILNGLVKLFSLNPQRIRRVTNQQINWCDNVVELNFG